MILDVAKLQLEGQFSTGDSLDAKAFGVLTIDIAAVGIVLAAQDRFGSMWGVPLVLAMLSAAPAIFMLIARSFDAGPRVEAFYNAYSDQPERTAVVRMLSEIVPALRSNDRVLAQKALASGLAIFFMTVALGFATVEFIFRPEVTIGCQSSLTSSSPAATGSPTRASAPPTSNPSAGPLLSRPTPSRQRRCLIGS